MIDVRGLSFSYVGSDRPAVEDLSFSIEPGEIFGFLGPSGAGKSTTQKILIGLLRGFDGEVSLLGRDLRSWGPDLYERVGVSFEVPNLYLKLSAIENLRYYASLFSETADPLSLLERVGLAADADQRVSTYSKGMRGRLGFARALLNRADLLFLDEPTAGLDPVNARKVKDIVLAERAAGRTVFLTTHDMSVADELCDRVALIVEGGIRSLDSPRALKLRHGRPSVRVEYRSNGALESREFPLEGIGAEAEFLTLLREREIETIHTQETTLERVFIDVTGRSLT